MLYVSVLCLICVCMPHCWSLCLRTVQLCVKRPLHPLTWPDAHFDDVSPRQDEFLHHLSRYHVASLQNQHTVLNIP